MSIDFLQRPRYNGTNLALATEAGSGLMNVVEVDLGSVPRRSGTFDITTTGLTTNQHVIIEQINGPYTSKGTLADEAEMDQVSVTGQAISSTVIRCYWTSPTLVKGNFKFAYTLVSTLNTLPNATESAPGAMEYASQSEVDAGSVTDRGLSPARFHSSLQLAQRTTHADLFSDYVVSGFDPSVPGSGLVLTIPTGIAYIGGQRVSIAADTGRTYTASRDTYIDVNASGTYTPVAVTNGATEPSVTANSLRILKVVTSGTQVTAIAQRGRATYNKAVVPNFSAYRSVAQSITLNTFTIIQHNVVDLDSHGFYDATAWKFTPKIAGMWVFFVYCFINTTTTFYQYINLNSGTRYSLSGATTTGGLAQSAPINMNGSTDFAQHEMYLGASASTQAGLGQCQFGAYYLGRLS